MQILTAADLSQAMPTVGRCLTDGWVCILPTDTLYGLSVNAFDSRAVDRVNLIKQRRRPATLIPHDLEWARQMVAPRTRARLTAVWEAGRSDTWLFPFAPAAGAPRPAPALTASGLIAFRRPHHWVEELARDLRMPLVTTSANRTTRAPMTSLEDLPRAIARQVDLLVYEGPHLGPPSRLVFCDRSPPRVRVR